MTAFKVAAGAAALVLSLSGSVWAQDGTLVLSIGGEAYDGPPRFSVQLGDTELGEGAVGAAIDTAEAGRFAEAEDKTQYVEEFRFSVPEGDFDPQAPIRIRFLNEAFGGPGSGRDRNLYIEALTFNGVTVTASDFTTQTQQGPGANAMLGEFLVLYDGTADAVISPPEGGWPDAQGQAAEAAAKVKPVPAEAPEPAPTPEPEVLADATPPEAPVPAPDVAPETLAAAAPEVVAQAEPVAEPEPIAEPQDAPETVDAPEPETVPEPAPVPAPVQPAAAPQAAPASASPAATADASCTRSERYNVLGFNESSNDLTPALEERLDQILADIGTQRCRVQVVGYSSMAGNHATNALFAVERAQNVLRYLREQGLDAIEATAAGAGATDRFGPRLSDNRRVVISIVP